MKKQILYVVSILLVSQFASAAAPALSEAVFHPTRRDRGGLLENMGCIKKITPIEADKYRVEDLREQNLYKYNNYYGDCDPTPYEVQCKDNVCTNVIRIQDKNKLFVETTEITILEKDRFVFSIERNWYKNGKLKESHGADMIYEQTNSDLKKLYTDRISVLEASLLVLATLTDNADKLCRWDVKIAAIVANNLGLPVVDLNEAKLYYEHSCLKKVFEQDYIAYVEAATYGDYMYTYSELLTDKSPPREIYNYSKLINFEGLKVYLVSVSNISDLKEEIIAKTKSSIYRLKETVKIL